MIKFKSKIKFNSKNWGGVWARRADAQLLAGSARGGGAGQ